MKSLSFFKVMNPFLEKREFSWQQWCRAEHRTWGIFSHKLRSRNVEVARGSCLGARPAPPPSTSLPMPALSPPRSLSLCSA